MQRVTVNSSVMTVLKKEFQFIHRNVLYGPEYPNWIENILFAKWGIFVWITTGEKKKK